jgi:choline dehydrogenase-like flavoprotein
MTPKPGSHYHSVLVALTHPISRGSVHISSPNHLDKPRVDPNYLSNNIDRDLLLHALKFTRKLHDAEPLNELTKSYVGPAWDWEQGGEEEQELQEYLKNGMEPVYHPVSISSYL